MLALDTNMLAHYYVREADASRATHGPHATGSRTGIGGAHSRRTSHSMTRSARIECPFASR